MNRPTHSRARSTLALTLSLMALTIATRAQAEGMQGHMYVTELAVGMLDTPELKALLEARAEAYQVGSIFPDSGYWAQHAYGEEAHWEPFVEGYLAWIRANYAPPYDQGPAADHVAVLMGIASHVMSDQVFDILFLDKVGEVSGQDAKNQLDTHIDFFLVNDRNRKLNPADVTNAEVLSGVLRDRLGIDAPVATIRDGITRAKAGLAGVASTGFLAGPMRLVNPWASDNYLRDEVAGGYPHNARVVAGYFEMLWRRLHAEVDWDRMIAGSHPVAHAREHGVNHQSVDSWVTLFAGDPLRASSLGEGRFALLDASGAQVATHVRTRRDGHDEATTLQLRPAANLAYNAWYRVRFLPGVQTVRGDILDRELGFWFKTLCPPAPEACPDVPEPMPEPPEEPDAGQPEPDVDAGPSEPELDAGEAALDAGVDTGDAGTLPGQLDAGEVHPVTDAGPGAVDRDAESPMGPANDAGVQPPESPHTPEQPGDAGDAGAAAQDAAVDPGEGGDGPSGDGGGCSCATRDASRPSPTALLLMLCVVGLRVRRARERSRQV